MNDTTSSPAQVLAFWFDETSPKLWFAKDADFDAAIARRFAGIHAAATRAELWRWRGDADGRLAEIIVLDQFSRNLHRGSPAAFAHDALALVLAQELVARKLDQELAPVRRGFAYLPFMHSESALVQQQSLRLYQALAEPVNLDFARRHAEIIARFGRYPHRNAALGRASTPEEVEFLKQPGSSF
ncbi:DUF924 family protein [Comamonas sp. NLF-1-9]|uniref:DUF924 family protein n=1 Tax=Comamonas sp. NLF-1-9 TaxID=2853163 RepID=UPI001C46F92E|nr:DUF924 family protein [Comamonas sp. NLF-1-9]QXL83950.1 DUF924 domain-containing protein [Comamonas sp. NLF-1-9]